MGVNEVNGMASRNKRIVYLEDKPRSVAREELLERYQFKRASEMIAVENALGRVSFKPVFAQNSMPHFHASAMDGIAVVAEETYLAHERNPLRITPRQFAYVDTGNPVPSPFNAVIMIEYVQELETGEVEIISPATPWQHIRPIGEDITAEEMLFTEGHIFRPVDLGAMLASGITTVAVVKKPLVSIIPTGHELVAAQETPTQGKLIEFNGTVFANYVNLWGGNAKLFTVVTDDKDQIKQAILRAVQNSEMIIVNAGSSAGRRDYTQEVLAEIGEVFTHGVACRPGKPVIIGKVQGKMVIGIPGYPVSAYLSLEWFLRPLICQYLGIEEPVREKLNVKLGRRVVSTLGAEDFIRVTVAKVHEDYVAVPLPRAAGITMSLVRADAMLIIPPSIVGHEAGDIVQVELHKPLNEVANTLFFSGSHDMTLDLIASHWKKQGGRAISAHTGSMAGILAVQKGEAHVAGIHLLDPDTKDYNRSYVARFAGNHTFVLQPFLRRNQGWIVAKGNPLQIEHVRDLLQKDVQFVNRQKGAGTRILLDLMLREEAIDVAEISGYHREFFSHLSVAAEVEANAYTVGLGIYAAARILGLDFVPVADESYDLLMSESFYESKAGQQLLRLIRSDGLKKEINDLGGYEVVADRAPHYIQKNSKIENKEI